MFAKQIYLFVLGLFIWLSGACTPTITQEPAAQIPTIAVTATETAVTTSPPAELLAHTWQLLGAGGEADDMFFPLPNDPAWLRFSHHPDPNGSTGFSFEGFSGCNALFGSYVASNNTLTIDVGVTQQGCEPNLAAFEDFMLEVLRHQPTFAVTSESGTTYLTLQLPDDESGRLVFIGTETAVNEPGCSEGGVGVFTPDDVRCMLTNIDPAYVQMIDDDTAVHFTDPNAIADWVGGAIIYHIPTVSTLVLDKFGDVDPQFGVFNSRAGLAALSEAANDAGLMADFKQQVQTNWAATSTNEPEIRLSVAWQDGETTIFLVAVAGLSATDDRFYCASQTWTIGDEITEIAADCMAHEAVTPVHHVLFESKQIKGSDERPVQVALNGVPSNTVLVQEGEVSQETAIYDTVLQSLTHKFLIVRAETAVAGTIPSELETAVDPTLLQNYLAANETSSSLRFLFQNSNRYLVHANASIERDYLPVTEGQPNCEAFRNNYPNLGGIVTLSQVGASEDGTQTMVHVQHECGSADDAATYYILTQTDGGWQIIDDPIGG